MPRTKNKEYQRGFKDGIDAGYRAGCFSMAIIFANAMMKTVLECNRKTKKKADA